MIFNKPSDIVVPGGKFRVLDTGRLDLSNFMVVTMISNQLRFSSRYTLYRKFEQMVASSGVKFVTAEVAFGDAPFMITDRDNPMHLQYRTVDELWVKEMAINGAINYALQLHPDVKKIAWIDADVFPVQDPLDWFEQTSKSLDHYEFVQMFETAQDMTPDFNPIGKLQTGFMAAYVKSGYAKPTRAGFWDLGGYSRHGHPGYAWAANVDALNKVGNLIDFSILGSADRNMATGLIGCIDYSFPDQVSGGYKKALLDWQDRATRYIKRDVGYVPGMIYHYWHGKKKSRGYSDRWKILVNQEYDPTIDIKRDAQGLYILETWDDRQIMMRDLIRSYFRARNEDSIDVE